MRILLVADPTDRELIRKSLDASDLGAAIEDANDGTAALATLGMQAFDCVLVGDELGDMRGTQLVSALRERGSHVPIVIVTSNPDLELADAGATDFTWKQELVPRRIAMRIRFAIRVGKAEAATARALAARDEILAIVSHDLRGPLHAVGLACEALRGITPEEGYRYIGAIERASSRAERLIADLLEASAIENGALAMNVRPIDAVAVMRQAAADHELLAKESQGSIQIVVPPGSTMVAADRDRVLQVLGNLIGNALKHARGTPIELRLDRRDRDAVFAVRDAGPGISESELPHVFDRYWRGRTKRSGTGLGLAIAKGIVDAHGGTIDAKSHGGGAEFAFTIPLVRG